MIEDRVTKANRAIFLVRQALTVGSNVSVSLAESIFDKKITPILLYGCPMWGVPQIKNILKLQVEELPSEDKKSFIVNAFSCIGCHISKEDIASIR